MRSSSVRLYSPWIARTKTRAFFWSKLPWALLIDRSPFRKCALRAVWEHPARTPPTGGGPHGRSGSLNAVAEQHPSLIGGFMRTLRFMAGIAMLALLSLIASPHGAQAQELLKIRLGGVPTDDLTPVYWAVKTGMYQKAGLDVQVIPTS